MVSYPKTLQTYLDLFADISERIPHYCEPETLLTIVHPAIYFQDPFTTLRGVQDFHKLLCQTVEDVNNPSFDIQAVSAFTDISPYHYCVKWRFQGQVKRLGAWDFEGMSEIVLADDNRILSHIDYWNPTEPVYERVPLLKSVMKIIRSKAGLRQ